MAQEFAQKQIMATAKRRMRLTNGLLLASGKKESGKRQAEEINAKGIFP